MMAIEVIMPPCDAWHDNRIGGDQEAVWQQVIGLCRVFQPQAVAKVIEEAAKVK